MPGTELAYGARAVIGDARYAARAQPVKEEKEEEEEGEEEREEEEEEEEEELDPGAPPGGVRPVGCPHEQWPENVKYSHDQQILAACSRSVANPSSLQYCL
eukprot:2399874-Rhodomonas_salina.1